MKSNKFIHATLLLPAWMVMLCLLMSLHFILIPLFLEQYDTVMTYSPTIVQHADPVFTHIPILRKLLGGIPSFGDQFVLLEDVEVNINAWPRLPYYLMSLISYPVMNHLDVIPLVSTVLLTPVHAALLYVWVRRITGSISVSILGSSVALLFRELFVLQPWHWVNVNQIKGLLNSPFFSNALIHPQISFGVCCFSLILIYQFMMRPSKKLCIGIGIVYGVSFYTYFYLWTYLTLLLGLIGIYLLFQRDIASISLMLKAVCLALVISTFYWMDYWQFSQTAGFVDFQDRFALSRIPDLTERLVNLRPHLITVLFFIFVISIRSKQYLYLLLVVVAAEILWKAPIVIGRDYQSLHYAYHFFGPFVAIVFMFLLRELLFKIVQPNSFFVAGIVFISAIVVTSIGLYRSYQYSLSNHTAFSIEKDVYDAYEFVQNNVSAGSIIVVADPEVNMRIRNVAPVYVYVPSGYGTFATTDEMLTRYIEMKKFYGIDLDYSLDYKWYDSIHDEYIEPGLLETSRWLFNGSLKYSDNILREEAIVSVNDSRQFKSLTYDADLVWFGPYEKAVSDININKLQDLMLVYSNNSVDLYKFAK